MLFAKTVSNNCDMSKEWHCLGYFNKKMEKSNTEQKLKKIISTTVVCRFKSIIERSML